MFGKLRERLTGGAKRLSGRTDLLEGIAAACALVAAADGDLEDSEMGATLDALMAHEAISASFPQSEVERTVDKMWKRAKGGMAGRLGLKREIEDVKSKSSSEDVEMLFAIACDIAMADGEVEPAERKVLEGLAQTLGLNARNYLDA